MTTLSGDCLNPAQNFYQMEIKWSHVLLIYSSISLDKSDNVFEIAISPTFEIKFYGSKVLVKGFDECHN